MCLSFLLNVIVIAIIVSSFTIEWHNYNMFKHAINSSEFSYTLHF